MRGLNLKVLRVLGFALVVLLVSGIAHAQTPAGTWQPLKNAPPFSPGTALLLTDGTIMVEDYGSGGGSQHWWRLTPDNTGNYVNGTWTARADMQSSYGPLYFASAWLHEGRDQRREHHLSARRSRLAGARAGGIAAGRHRLRYRSHRTQCHLQHDHENLGGWPRFPEHSGRRAIRHRRRPSSPLA